MKESLDGFLFPACQNSPVHAGLADSSRKAGLILSPGEPKHESSKLSCSETESRSALKKKFDLKVWFMLTSGQETAKHTSTTQRKRSVSVYLLLVLSFCIFSAWKRNKNPPFNPGFIPLSEIRAKTSGFLYWDVIKNSSLNNEGFTKQILLLLICRLLQAWSPFRQ